MMPLLRHARYVLSENPITGLAFGLFALFLVAAVFGPALAPYSPLQSNAAMALKPPSAAHWFGTDQLGRDIFSRVLVATRLDLTIAFASVILAFFLGALSGVAAGYFGGWTWSAASPTPSWPSRCSCWPWASWPHSATR